MKGTSNKASVRCEEGKGGYGTQLTGMGPTTSRRVKEGFVKSENKFFIALSQTSILGQVQLARTMGVVLE